MADVQAILSKLKKVKGAGHGKWSALCPAHADKKPSLSVGLGEDGKVLLHCHAGCDMKNIVAAIGMTEADLFADAPAQTGKPEVVATYDYTDMEGKLLYQVVRRSDKSFRQRRPDGRGGWVWNIKGTQRVLYNLPYVASTPIEDWVFIVEGEKDVDNLRELNIAATTNSGGAGKWHQVADDSVLHGRQVAIIPDNDEPGREHAQQVAHALDGKAKVVKIIKLPRMPEKGDVSDWLARFKPTDGATPYTRLRKYAQEAEAFIPAGLGLCENANATAEIAQLLKAARLRPVAELGRPTVRKPSARRKGRSTWLKADLTFEILDAVYARGREVLADEPSRLAELDMLGWERELMYKTMVLTGLRKGELASLTIGQVYLDAQPPFAELLAKDEKAGRGAKIPLRADLVNDLRDYLAQRLKMEHEAALRAGRAVSMRLATGSKLFTVPRDFIKIFDRDLAAAGIAKHDERGRVVDIHALRHTFGTHLSKAGVTPRVAMAAMRHSSLDLTMNIYTDPILLDVGAAVDALPEFSADLPTPIVAAKA